MFSKTKQSGPGARTAMEKFVVIVALAGVVCFSAADARSCSDVLNSCLKRYSVVRGKQNPNNAVQNCRNDFDGCLKTGTWAGRRRVWLPGRTVRMDAQSDPSLEQAACLGAKEAAAGPEAGARTGGATHELSGQKGRDMLSSMSRINQRVAQPAT